MSNLELKGGLLELISSINDRQTLLAVKNLITEYIKQHPIEDDFFDELSFEQQMELDKAIEESYDETTWEDHDAVVKKFKK